jgi:hypothetical protein
VDLERAGADPQREGRDPALKLPVALVVEALLRLDPAHAKGLEVGLREAEDLAADLVVHVAKALEPVPRAHPVAADLLLHRLDFLGGGFAVPNVESRYERIETVLHRLVERRVALGDRRAGGLVLLHQHGDNPHHPAHLSDPEDRLLQGDEPELGVKAPDSLGDGHILAGSTS